MAQRDTSSALGVRSALLTRALVAVATLSFFGCAHDLEPPRTLVINEVLSDNDAAWVDELGETEDLIELANPSSEPIELDGYRLEDGRGRSFDLPDVIVPARSVLLFYADDDEDQGELHLPFKIAAAGETLTLYDADDRVLDRVAVPALGVNDAYARFPSGRGEFRICRYASPERHNGERCEPPAPVSLPSDETFEPYTWPEPAYAPKGPLVITELALLPARFIEVINVGDETFELDAAQLQLDALRPGQAWPTRGTQGLAWERAQIEPGERLVVTLQEDDLAALASDPAFEGVVTLFGPDGEIFDRVDFMRWPEGAALTRIPDADGRLRFCRVATEGEENDECDPVPAREVGDRLRHLYTPGDFAALAEGETSLSSLGVKVVIDIHAGYQAHLLATRAWALHYAFVRERIENLPRLDRCDSTEAALFKQGWYAFSDVNYAKVEGRRYLLGTLARHAGSGMKTFDFSVGDMISGAQMKDAFFSTMLHLDVEDLHAWALRPSEPRQETAMREIEGEVPIVGQNAPFSELTYQPLTPGVAFGKLSFMTAEELEEAVLGPDVIVVTDAVPNDLPLVAGLITEAFQTPLAHVNVLSQNRSTPNMALRDARNDPEIEARLGTLVRLEVTAAGFSLTEASAEEVAEFRRSRMPAGPTLIPRIDATVRGVVDLEDKGLEDLPSLGAKAAQLGELARVETSASCPGGVSRPEAPFAIPVAHYLDHFETSGARALLSSLREAPAWDADPEVRASGLERVRKKILDAEVDAALLESVTSAVRARFGERSVRFRSSSNTEDLPGFSGAGLYTSVSVELDDPDKSVQKALLTVWASLWTPRAYDEREPGRVDQAAVAMGILVHASFKSERANVIAISRDVLDPTRSDHHYMNAQIGEASVANPAPGVTTEELIHRRRFILGTPELEYTSQSSLARGDKVLSLADVRRISCQVRAIHLHFQKLLDPQGENRWFAMDTEVKIVGDARDVVIKQARPYSFGRADIPADCREF